MEKKKILITWSIKASSILYAAWDRNIPDKNTVDHIIRGV